MTTKHKVEIVDIRHNEQHRIEYFTCLKDAVSYCEYYNATQPEFYKANLCEPVRPSSFQRVVELNEAFGNAKGDSKNIDWAKVGSQCANLMDEHLELLEGLGLAEICIKEIKSCYEYYTKPGDFINPPNTEAVRDALCDMQVFGQGAQHLMGYDGDRDMDDVLDGVFTRFIKDEQDMLATYAMHSDKGVASVYFEGEFPKMVMKSRVDQPDAPIGKVLKSASYTNTKFREAP